jgi:hypothetical protein
MKRNFAEVKIRNWITFLRIFKNLKGSKAILVSSARDQQHFYITRFKSTILHKKLLILVMLIDRLGLEAGPRSSFKKSNLGGLTVFKYFSPPNVPFLEAFLIDLDTFNHPPGYFRPK